MQNLSQFKKAVTLGAVFMVRNGGFPEAWTKHVVVCVQTNALASASRLELTGNPETESKHIALCQAEPKANASWHWYGKASHYCASPDCAGTIRYNPRPDLPDAWLEFRPATPEEIAITKYI